MQWIVAFSCMLKQKIVDKREMVKRSWQLSQRAWVFPSGHVSTEYMESKKTVNPFKHLYFMNQSTYLQKTKLKWKAETLTILKNNTFKI